MVNHPYRSPPEKEKSLYRPRTLWGKLRRQWRRFLVRGNGRWRRRYIRCDVCGEPLRIREFGTYGEVTTSFVFNHYLYHHDTEELSNDEFIKRVILTERYIKARQESVDDVYRKYRE